MSLKSLWSLIIVAVFILYGCSSHNEEEASVTDDFSISVSSESKIEVEVQKHDCVVRLDGKEHVVVVDIIGEYSFMTAPDISAFWIDCKESIPHAIVLSVDEFSEGRCERSEVIDFYVGTKEDYIKCSIKVIQSPLQSVTYEQLLQRERDAINRYLSGVRVEERLPADGDFIEGADAPFYKMNNEGSVYMQVVDAGSGIKAVAGDQIYFRFMRYNLMSVDENGNLPAGEGNWNEITPSSFSYVYGSDKPSTLQWGDAILMPQSVGLSTDCEVNLVVATEAGLLSERQILIPFLYHIRYYRAII